MSVAVPKPLAAAASADGVRRAGGAVEVGSHPVRDASCAARLPRGVFL
jgi:hypothetical protein